MIGNIVVALSSLVFAVPMMYADSNDDLPTSLSILSVLFFSFVSHLFENHKRGSIGFPRFSKKASIILNWLDRLGVAIVSYRFINLYLENDIPVTLDDVVIVTATAVLGLVSEMRVGSIWRHHIPIHSVWHALVARNMMIFLNRVYTPTP